jgi:hypothetical protein
MGPWNRTHCAASQCINSKKLSKRLRKEGCVAGVYDRYCPENEYLCCQESLKCKSRQGRCIDLRSEDCKSGLLVLGYCEEWGNASASSYSAFCCESLSSEPNEHGILITGWVFFCLSVVSFLALASVLCSDCLAPLWVLAKCAIVLPSLLVFVMPLMYIDLKSTPVILGWVWVAVFICLAWAYLSTE